MGKAQTAIRFTESIVQITVDGKKQRGTFENIRNFSVTPDAELKKEQYAGEKRRRIDLIVNGYDLSFEAHESDDRWLKLWRRFEEADLNGARFPEVSLAITNNYRGESPRTLVLHGNLVLKLDDYAGSSDEYNRTSWTGACQFLIG